MLSIMKAGLFVSLFILILPLESKAGPLEDLMAKLEICRDLETPEKRLRCFEALVPQGDISLSLTPSLKLIPLFAPREKEEEPSKVIPVAPQETEPLVVDRRDSFGAEHIPESKDDQDDRTNTYLVIRTQENRNKLYFFYMENGQVWRQLERQRLFVPKDREFEVVITQGSFGDYKMRIEGKGRQTRVKRVK